MDLEQLRDMLRSKVQEVNPWGVNEIVDDILSTFAHAEIAEYADGSDEQILSLIAETKKRMNSEAHSPGREFPKLSLSSQSKAIKRKSAEEHVLKNRSDTGIDIEKRSATITQDMVRPVTHSPPSHSGRAFIGEDLTGSACVLDGFKPLGRLEMDIRQFLRDKPFSFMIADLPPDYFERYKMSVVHKGWNWSTLLRLLDQLCTTKVLHERRGPCIILLEYTSAPRVGDSGSNKIYITSSNAHSSFIEKHVRNYFSQYGPVIDSIIHKRSPHMLGVVEFKDPGSVTLLLREWRHQVPHLIFSGSPFECYQTRVFINTYEQKDKLRYSNSAEEQVLKNECSPGTVTEMASPVTHSTPSQRALEGEVVTESTRVSDGPDGPSTNEHTQDSIALLPDVDECFYNQV